MLERLEKLDTITECRSSIISRGYHDSLGTEVAIRELKEPLKSDPRKAAAFFDEARNVARLNYEHILKVHDLDEKSGWVVTELMEGSLANLIVDAPMPPERVRSVTQQVLRALNYLHSERILYGKVRPSKLLYNRRGRIKLGLFEKIGTNLMPVPEDAKYVAPETIDARFGDIGPPMDLYCLGFAALELLMGPKFNAQFAVMADDESMARIGWLRWHTSDQTLPSAAKLVPEAPADLVQLIDALLIKDVTRRPQTALEAFAKLDSVPIVPVIEGGDHSIALHGRGDPLGISTLSAGGLVPPVGKPKTEPAKPEIKAAQPPPPVKPKSPAPPAAKIPPAAKKSAARPRRGRKVFAFLLLLLLVGGSGALYWYGRGQWWPPYPAPVVPPVLLDVSPKEAEVLAGGAKLSRDANGKVILPVRDAAFTLAATAEGFRELSIPDMTMDRLKSAGYKVELQPDPNYFFEIGKKEFDAGRFPQAIEAFDKVLKVDPKFAEALFYRGSARFRQEDSAGAVQDLTEYLNLSPKTDKRAEVLFIRGSAYAKLGKTDEAIQDLAELFAQTPRDDLRPVLSKLYFDRGGKRLQSGSFNDAITDFEAAVKIAPDNAAYKQALADAYYRRAKSALERRDYGTALTDLNRSLELDKSKADVLATRSGCQQQLGANDKALADITAAIGLEKKPEYYLQRARLHRAMKQPQPAIDDLTTALGMREDFAAAYAERGAILDEELGDYENAIQNYRDALTNGYTPAFILNLAIGDARRRIAEGLVKNSQYSKAVDQYGQLISHLADVRQKASADEQAAVQKRILEAHRGLGKVYGMQRDYQSSIDEFGKAIKESGEQDYEAYELRGRVHHRMSNFDAAKVDFDKALQLNKDYRPARLSQAQLQIKKGYTLIENRSSVPANEREALTKEAVACYRAAIAELVTLIEAQPDDRLCYDQIIEAYDQLGQVVGNDPAIPRERNEWAAKRNQIKK